MDNQLDPDYARASSSIRNAGVEPADPLLGDTQRFAEKLRAAHVACEVKSYPGLPHAFVMLNRIFDGAKAAVRDLASAAQRFVA